MTGQRTSGSLGPNERFERIEQEHKELEKEMRKKHEAIWKDLNRMSNDQAKQQAKLAFIIMIATFIMGLAAQYLMKGG